MKLETTNRKKTTREWAPKKKPKVDLTQVQFECDTSISLSSDTDLDQRTPSPEKPAAERIDRPFQNKNRQKSDAQQELGQER